MKGQQFFCWHTGKDSVKNGLIMLLLAGGLAAFWIYRLYAAALIVLVLMLLLAVYQLRLIGVEESGVWQFHWMRRDVQISREEIRRLDVRMQQDTVFVCLYGEKDILEFPYREKTVGAVLTCLGISGENVQRLLKKKGEDFQAQEGMFTLRRETVLLDALTGKKPFYKIEVFRPDKMPVQSEEAAIRQKAGQP